MFNLTVRAKDFKDLKEQLSGLLTDLENEEEQDVTDFYRGAEALTRNAALEEAIVNSTKTRTASETIALGGGLAKQFDWNQTEVTGPLKETIQESSGILSQIPFIPAPHVPNGLGVDSRGIPWDARVHASSKTINRDGTWRTRRNMDSETLHKVEASLVQRVIHDSVLPPTSIPHVPPIPPIQNTQVQFIPPQPVVPAPPSTPMQFIPQQPAYVPPQQVALAPIQVPNTFDPITPMHDSARPRQAHDIASFKATLIPSLAKLVEQGRITPEYVTSLKNYFGVKEIWEVANDPAKLTEMFENFAAAGLINKVG
jgi:hypothetical protein